MSQNSDNTSRKELLKQAFLKIQDLQSRLQAKDDASRTKPVAVIGLGCRFPGEAENVEGFWKVLSGGVDTVGDVPQDRWDMEAYFDPDPEIKGKIYTRRAAFLKHIDRFDPQFFGISPREADKMDPQQRLLLEVVWEALENAGQASDRLLGSDTGVFVALNGDDYAHLMSRAAGTDAIDLYFGTGVARSIAAGRISYTFGLKGPCLSLDTACSGSLVSVHLACQSLRMRECRMAVAGGVTLIITPDGHIIGSKGKMLSPDGRCKVFDASADGYVRGEGCGIIVLKRLADAIADRDNVIAVIRGTAINQDGRSAGMTAPNGNAQEDVIRKALEDGRMSPNAVGYVETHGTGTELGDPIEVQALGQVYGQQRDKTKPLYIGAVKTNIGHLEAAAGIAGLVKTILILQHGVICPNLHFDTPNPHIPWEQLPLKVPTTNIPWPSDQIQRIAAVSAFGFSGTNAHLIVEAGPAALPETNPVERDLHPLTISAKSAGALRDMAQRYSAHLNSNRDCAAANVCSSANTGRQHHSHRLVVLGRNLDDLIGGLGAYSDNRTDKRLIHHEPVAKRPKVAFLFTGQGAQYIGMGRNLYETEPVFRDTLDRCDKALRGNWQKSLLSILYPKPGFEQEAEKLLHQTAYTQPALFAVEYALFSLWRSWGVLPAMVMGHSVGEFAAACAADVFSLEEGIGLIAQRGQLMQDLTRPGKMAAIILGTEIVEEAIRTHGWIVSVAAVNGPENTVISGADDEVDKALRYFEAQGIKFSILKVSQAFHSSLMDPVLDAFGQTAAKVQYKKAQLEIVSNATGQLVEDGQITSSAYWTHHIRSTVRFKDSIQLLHSEGCRIFVEIGPHPTLLGMAAACLTDTDVLMMPCMRRGHEDCEQLLKALGNLYVRGVAIDWQGFDKGFQRTKVQLPTYAFQRDRYWAKLPEHSSAPAQMQPMIHPLLHRRLHLPKTEDIIMETVFDIKAMSFLKDHRIFGTLVVPATAYLEMGLAAAGYIFGNQTYWIQDFNIFEPLLIAEDESVVVQVVLSPAGSHGFQFEIFSRLAPDDALHPEWKRHATGNIETGDMFEKPSPRAISPEEKAAMEVRCSELVGGNLYYDQLKTAGVDYGPAFQGLESIRKGKNEVIASISPPDTLDVHDAYHIHPAILDTCFQALGLALNQEGVSKGDEHIYLPMGLSRYQIHDSGQVAWCHGTIHSSPGEAGETFLGDVQIFAIDGRLCAQLSGIRFKRAAQSSLRRLRHSSMANWFYQTAWRDLDPIETGSGIVEKSSYWLIFADPSGIGEKLADAIRNYGARVHLVSPGQLYDEPADDRTIIRPRAAEDYRKLFQRVEGQSAVGIQGIIHLWSLAFKTPNVDANLPLAWMEAGWHSLLYLVQTYQKESPKGSCKLSIVTSGATAARQDKTALHPSQSLIWGLARVIASEMPDLHSKLIDLAPSSRLENDCAALLEEVTENQRSENQIALHQGKRLGLRLVKAHVPEAIQQDMPQAEEQPYQLEIGTRGIIENLQLRPLSIEHPAAGEIQIRIDATGLNFRDVLNVLDMYPGDPGPLGNECVGRIVAVGEGVRHLKVGETVMAITPRAYCSYVNVRAEMAAVCPSNLGTEAAATIPMAFLTAYYALNHIGRMKAGERVLIHAAAGGVGMAAVQLAQQAGAEVFATAGNDQKRQRLRSMGVRFVMSSRTLDFADQVLEQTNGQGVDIVLNSLAGDFISKSFSVLGKNGRFLEIGKAELWTPEQVAEINPNVTYSTIFLGDVCRKEPELIQSMFAELLHDFQEDRLKPLPYHHFYIKDVEAAFRFMAQAKHIGKIIIDQREKQTKPVFRSDATYVITGGLGGLGLSFSKCLVQRGARHLILASRRPPGEEQKALIRQLADDSVEVIVTQADVSIEADVQRLLASNNPAFPIRGIIHAAGTVDDASLANQSAERFAKVLRPKVDGSWFLHIHSLNLDLDFFVLCSAGAALFGAAGQANYSAANTFMDGLVWERRRQGLPALSLNWGPWAQVGMAAALSENEHKRWQGLGMGFIDPDQGALALLMALNSNVPQLAVLPMDWSIYQRHVLADRTSRFLSEVVPHKGPLQDRRPEYQEDDSFLSLMNKADPEDRKNLLFNHVRDQLVRALELRDSADILPDQGLTDLGMDSLMAVEISNRLKRSLGCSLPSTLAFEYPTLNALTDYLAEEVLGQSSDTGSSLESKASTDGQENIKDEVQNLSESEAEESLLQQLNNWGY